MGFGISVVTIIIVYWIVVVVTFMVRARRTARRRSPGPDGQIVLSGQLGVGRALLVLAGPPAVLWFVVWLAAR